MRALIIDDDIYFCNKLKNTLQKTGIKCDISLTAEEGLELLNNSDDYSFICLDFNLPDKPGGEVVKIIRLPQKNQKSARLAKIPIIMISAIEDPIRNAGAFSDGADDCINKSNYNASEKYENELLGRIYSIIRRSKGSAQNLIPIRDLSIDLETKTIYLFHQKVPLSKKEYELLELLIMNPKRVINKDAIMSSLYYNSMKIYDHFDHPTINHINQANKMYKNIHYAIKNDEDFDNLSYADGAQIYEDIKMNRNSDHATYVDDAVAMNKDINRNSDVLVKTYINSSNNSSIPTKKKYIPVKKGNIPTPKIVDVMVCKIRKKFRDIYEEARKNDPTISDSKDNFEYIHTGWGFGYQLY